MKKNLSHNFWLEDYIYAVRKSGDYVLPHQHDTYEIVYYDGGNGVITIEGKEFRFSDGTVHIVKPDALHNDFSSKTGRVYCIVAHLPPERVFDSCVINKNDKNAKIVSTIKQKMVKLFKLWTERPRNVEKENELVWNITILVSRLIDLSNKSTKEFTSVINYTEAFVEKNFNRHIDFRDLAENLGYSYDRFRHIFQHVVGASLKEYQLGIRLAQAKDKLIRNKTKIQTIAQNIGFSSYVRFEIWFKEKMGISPREFRRMSIGKIGVISLPTD